MHAHARSVHVLILTGCSLGVAMNELRGCEQERSINRDLKFDVIVLLADDSKHVCYYSIFQWHNYQW